MHAGGPPRFGDELRREWRLLLASMLGISCAISTLGLPYSIGVMVQPLQQQFGWSVTQIFAVQPIITAAVVAMSAAVGWWVDRFPVRPLVLASHVGFGLGILALGTLTDSLWSFYVIYFVAALLGGGMLAVAYMKLVVPRFERERGLALGIALAGSGISSFLYQPVLVRIVDQWGWRSGYLAIAALILCVALPVAIAFVRDPLANQAIDDRAAAAQATATGLSMPEALRNYRFWVLFAVFFLFSGSITGVLNSFVPVLTELGYTRSAAADITGVFGLSIIVGRVCVGMLIDRIWAPLVGCVLFAASAVGFLLLSVSGLPLAAHVVVVALGGLAAGAEVDLMAYLVSRYFGVRAFGKIYGAVYIGFALGPGPLVPLFGWLRDSTGSYSQGLVYVAVSMALAALLLLSLGRYPRGMLER